MRFVIIILLKFLKEIEIEEMKKEKKYITSYRFRHYYTSIPFKERCQIIDLDKERRQNIEILFPSILRIFLNKSPPLFFSNYKEKEKIYDK